MTAVEELRHLHRQFPRSRELAVSRDLLDRYICEMVWMERYVTIGHRFAPPHEEHVPLRDGGHLHVFDSSLIFRNARLVLTERVH